MQSARQAKSPQSAYGRCHSHPLNRAADFPFSSPGGSALWRLLPTLRRVIDNVSLGISLFPRADGLIESEVSCCDAISETLVWPSFGSSYFPRKTHDFLQGMADLQPMGSRTHSPRQRLCYTRLIRQWVISNDSLENEHRFSC